MEDLCFHLHGHRRVSDEVVSATFKAVAGSDEEISRDDFTGKFDLIVGGVEKISS